MQNKNKIIFTTIIILLCGCSHQIKSAENWIDYNSLSTINAGMSQNDLEKALGEPLLVLGNNDNEENAIHLFYNYHVKRYLPKTGERDAAAERNTLIRFTFENDELISWEEDNITLNMSQQSAGGGGLIKYINLFINFVLLIAVFGGS